MSDSTAIPEDLPVTQHHDVYPGIAPSKFTGSMDGKVVFITGASRGIGEATAGAFAQSGASLFLAGRKTDTLEKVKSEILKSSPNTKIGYHATDVVEYEDVKQAVEACIKMFGKIDVVVNNSGTLEEIKQMHEQDPALWWRTWEVNVKGCFNVAHCAMLYLRKTRGYMVFMSSAGAQLRFPGMSSYQSGKHALNRIAEFVQEENGPFGVKVFAIHPGAIRTELSKDIPAEWDWLFIDTVELAAWSMVRLASGSEDYLSGRFVSCNWDLDEVGKRFKDSIVRDDALKNRLTLPKEAYVV